MVLTENFSSNALHKIYSAECLPQTRNARALGRFPILSFFSQDGSFCDIYAWKLHLARSNTLVLWHRAVLHAQRQGKKKNNRLGEEIQRASPAAAKASRDVVHDVTTTAAPVFPVVALQANISQSPFPGNINVPQWNPNYTTFSGPRKIFIKCRHHKI